MGANSQLEQAPSNAWLVLSSLPLLLFSSITWPIKYAETLAYR